MPAKIDAPIWMHWKKAGLWAAVEGVVLTGSVLTQQRFSGAQVPGCPGDPTPNCSKSSALACLAAADAPMPAGARLQLMCPCPRVPGCTSSAHACFPCPLRAAALLVMACLFFTGLLAYFVLWFVCIRRAFRAMLKLPYAPNRRANFVIRMQVGRAQAGEGAARSPALQGIHVRCRPHAVSCARRERPDGLGDAPSPPTLPLSAPSRFCSSGCAC